MGETVRCLFPSAPASVLGQPGSSSLYGAAPTQPWVCLLKTPVRTGISITRALLVDHLPRSLFFVLVLLNYGLAGGLQVSYIRGVLNMKIMKKAHM